MFTMHETVVPVGNVLSEDEDDVRQYKGSMRRYSEDKVAMKYGATKSSIPTMRINSLNFLKSLTRND